MSVARSYSKALYESAKEKGLSSGDMDRIENDLASFSAAMASNENLNEALVSPIVSATDKVVIAQKTAEKLGLSKLTTDFVALMAKKNRVSHAGDILDGFKSVRLESEGGIFGSVVSAEELSASDVEELAKAFTKKLGKKIVFKTAIDPTLLAGLRVTVNGVTYDGSVRSQLQQLRDRLVYGKSNGVH